MPVAWLVSTRIFSNLETVYRDRRDTVIGDMEKSHIEQCRMQLQ